MNACAILDSVQVVLRLREEFLVGFEADGVWWSSR